VNIDDFKNLAAGIQSIVTSLALVVGGVWAALRFRRAREGMPLIEPALDVLFVRRQCNRRIIDVVATLENKGKARLEIEKFTFQLRYSLLDDKIAGGTILVPDMPEFEKDLSFPEHLELKQSWLEDDNTIILEPGIRALHSISTSVPEEATMVLVSIEFAYKGKESETDIKLVAVPAER
jgi:hypothetical protein